jgi:hypothetical protein
MDGLLTGVAGHAPAIQLSRASGQFPSMNQLIPADGLAPERRLPAMLSLGVAVAMAALDGSIANIAVRPSRARCTLSRRLDLGGERLPARAGGAAVLLPIRGRSPFDIGLQMTPWPAAVSSWPRSPDG